MSLQINDIEIEHHALKYAPKWDRESRWIDGGYDTCEKIAFDLLFGVDNWNIRYKHVDNDYQGTTRILVQKTKEPEEGQFAEWVYFDYGWGSCSGCDTLEGSGVVEAVKMIMESKK